MENKKIIILATGSVLVFIGAVWYFRRSRGKQNFASFDPEPLTYKPGFLPSHQGPHFEGMPPSLKVENDYHSLMIGPDTQGGCNGDYGNFECRQKSYIKAMKAGTTDKADLICYRHHPSRGGDENQYYACLDAVYGNYQWMDRFVGVGSCSCVGPEGQYTGTFNADGSCFCPSDRPLHDRRLVDSQDQIVTRVGY
jgi:hypothetical protein